ncbi:MAG TPA: complex I NDUFA9 subunit family protein [Accumulibacter sp.]|uniref:complex I NDUFA9 subunit family protein n=1 Tax=Accumulibacter sp. TaxID=2053492 RepID=UPI0025D19EFC|nr:complex I NDUFA9 subunit family protein [Accumulibacter sp.]MCM8600396.1 complex I NDUFA9 subunit family protein [Accumulibacter sp.]MCM8661854.1 complex I NDUFA9 subunit family protein [Accumulibacter sp.]HNC52165.1 complex I NDUFA9 subunit family protein [Accumulibacter sp.]
MKLENVLLIGGSGFVGGWIASRLSDRGIRVTIPTRHRDNSKRLTTLPMVDMVEAKVHDPQTLADLMQGQDAVINLVGILHDGDSRLPYGKGFAAAHVELPKKILAAMRQSGVRRLVHMSALQAASKGPSEYLRSKGEGEALVRAAIAEFDITIFRPSVIFGANDAFLNMFAKLARVSPVLPLGAGNARFQPVYVGDVATAFADCLNDGATFGQTYDLCGPKTYTLREIVEYTAQLVGRSPRIIDLGTGGWAYLQAGLLWLLPKPPLSPDNLRSMEVDSVSDGSHDYPGWQPRALEAVAPTYLSAVELPQARLDRFRYRAGR